MKSNVAADDANRALREMTSQATIIETPAQKAETAIRQASIMNKFFGRLSGRERRVLRSNANRLSGHKETFAEMTARLTRPEFAPAAQADPTPKSSDDDRGPGRAGASL